MRSFIRLIVRSSVDLPQPDGPMSAVICFGVNAMDTSFTARNAP